MQSNKGVFTISLDFELYWGIFDKIDLNDRLTYFSNTRATIPKMLRLFDQYGIHVTWAAVGMLFAENWEEWEELKPAYKPEYINEAINPYRLKEIYGHKKELEYCFFAPNLVREIVSFENQELGTHTYSHYFCQEAGQNLNSFEADIKVAVQLGKQFGTAITSLVFPRNQIREDYLQACYQQGIQSVRSNPSDWFWKDTGNETLMKKVFRTGDAFLPMGVTKSYNLSSVNLNKNDVVQIPASRFLRPYSSKNTLNNLRLNRILNEMEYAAKKNQVYHLWWHPHNFGNYPKQSLEGLEVILKRYKALNSKYGMESLNMTETVRNLF
ncbi:polysaccharide deacetylase family protein [Pedobacter metabolipauper]|uniref:Polysaccharide deacetylase n=1 Tax=Pedobacter metabolipauper TaxID=425513 RepID=A0A4R6SVN5_9SPHI|nr:polysaccharide deacetylase family protein [Pedobacter metabolipauper]TDQ09938.1 polysaccharide deacetylase [Pedobacter metabolipauper]